MCKRGFMPIQSVMLDIDVGTNSAKTPPDYVKYVRVGSCMCGRILQNLTMIAHYVYANR